METYFYVFYFSFPPSYTPIKILTITCLHRLPSCATCHIISFSFVLECLVNALWHVSFDGHRVIGSLILAFYGYRRIIRG